ncbi:MAG: barstar family protein [Clostridia bacterium]|nr:barstar family protein [Clostridia bacterium]
MKYYTIDFTGVVDLSDFYQRIIKGLEFPDWCGESLDAIWDMLTEYIETPAHITVIDGISLTSIMTDKYKVLKEIFDRAVKWYAKYDEKLIFIYK